ncbi:fumarylacetoacetate hydrolase family protein [Microbacterium sp. VKM Ac-2923]|uniref:fumarylacetoacetate hydrolase family protein n=1 Tax=Microbacterium sp. VKM Ac-2923 TaxID=2929476 RepID=UPI001FB4E3C6|nr:fumarylacetoacetate hydrolase family protein [Microbacterium sp. VKM Ac-2923]MCJ1708814.1 fumarylacetoacetate hydrolase family protein [Microbacterium sp. VKM Ac-2923]
MRFARIGERGHEVPVVVVDGRYRDLRSLTLDIDAAFWESDPVDLVSRALAEGTLPELPDAAEARIGAPIARPGAVVCVGMNYAAHAAESGSLPPEQPVIFLKVPNTVAGPNDDVVLPRGGDKTDWEVELGIVIGQETSYLDSPDEALAHIAGFVLVNDLSERRFQLEVSGGQWSKGKCAPGFTPTGPWVVTPDEIDAGDLRLRSFVNGAPRQDSHTGDMIFSVSHIVWHLSQFMTLEPGDLVLTGTPEGVALSGRFPYLQPGDEVEISIDGLGTQRQSFSAWSRS